MSIEQNSQCSSQGNRNKPLSASKKLWIFLNLIRGVWVFLIVFLVKKQKTIIFEDLKVWRKYYGKFKNKYLDMLYMLVFYKEYRTVLAYRLKRNSLVKYALFTILFKPLSSLHIYSPKIGKGLFIQHGFSTVIAAHEIGEDCWINQQVTIGYTNATDAPVIGNRVKILAGAIVIGNVKLGDGCTVGAGAVVTKDVPPGATVVGVPARVIEKTIQP